MDEHKPDTSEDPAHDEDIYDPYKKADMIEAQKHRQAHYIKQIAKALKDGQSERCKCCGFPVHAEKYSLACSMLELSDLGSGFPLYFVYSKIIGGILLLGIFVVGIPCIVGNSNADRADDWNANKDSWIIKASLGNNGYNDHIFPLWQCALNVTFMILVIIIYHISRRWFESKDQEFNLMSFTPRDYTLHATGLGIDVNETDVKEFFEEFGRFDGKSSKVVKVVFAYKIKEYIENLRKLEDLGENLKMLEEFEKEGKSSSSGCCKKQLLQKEELKKKWK
jgi:hypothetical protein